MTIEYCNDCKFLIVQGDTLKNVTKEAKAIQKRIQDGDDEVFCDLSYTDKER